MFFLEPVGYLKFGFQATSHLEISLIAIPSEMRLSCNGRGGSTNVLLHAPEIARLRLPQFL